MVRLKRILARRSVAIFGWVVLWLAVIDAGVNLGFGTGAGASVSPALTRYFEYGRSVEGKLARALAADPKQGSILGAGWIAPDVLKQLPAKPQDGADMLVAVYGQSFSMNAANEATRMDPRISLRPVGGPGAPPTHSFAAYKADVEHRKADVVVFGVLSASVPEMGSLSGLIWLFENPAPFTFPRYRVVDGRLTEELPVIGSEAQFRDAFGRRSEQWQRFKEQLRRSDRGYDRFTFDESLADSSAVVRLVRRGWVAHRQAYKTGVYDPMEGFNPDAEEVHVLKHLLADMARRTRDRGERLVVLLLHTRGQSDHLHKAIERSLKENSIDYVSTHALFSANDPTNFLPDGHYTAAANRKLASALVHKIRGGTQSAALTR